MAFGDRPAQSWFALAALLAALAVAGAGCGRSTPSLSDFDRNADKLCTESAGEQEELRQDTDYVDLAAGPAALLTELAERRAKLADDLADLEPSDEQADDVAAFVRAQRARAEATLALARAETREPTKPPPPAAVRAERTAHERAVGLARSLNLEECAERLTPDAREEVVDAVEDAYTSPDAEDRCSQYGDRYVRDHWQGMVDRCVALEERVGPRAQVDVFGAEGIADVFATAAAHIGPDPEAGFLRLRLTFEDGRYRIDDTAPAGPEVAAHGPGTSSEGP